MDAEQGERLKIKIVAKSRSILIVEPTPGDVDVMKREENWSHYLRWG